MQDPNSNAWYYVGGNERLGPYSVDQMQALVKAGAINGSTLVWAQGMAEWVPFMRSTLASSIPTQAPQRFASDAGTAPVSSFGEAISTCFAKYVTFSGRASRPEFWYFLLFVYLLLIAAAIVDVGILGMLEASPVTFIVWLGLVLPYIAVAIRRLHDTDRSGWWLLIVFVPLAGIIALIVFFCQKGTEGPNRFG